MTSLFTTAHRTVSYVSGPLLIAEHSEHVTSGELVEVVAPTGERRRGQVLEIQGDRMIIQVLGGTTGLDIDATTVLVRAQAARLGVGLDLIGRVLDGMGRPIDGGPPLLPESERDLNGLPINPVARANPSEFIETGISAIDGLHTLVRGQKLPVFSGYGLPGLELATRIAQTAQVRGSAEGFTVVFAAIGVTDREAALVQAEFADGVALEHTVVLVNRAGEPAAERLTCPRSALTIAEYLAFERHHHVLVVLVDMTNYCEALRETAAARDEVPGRRGYPGYMYSDLASLYERAGRLHGRPGSITQLPVLSMPDDDVTHPIPDITGYITEGQIVLSRELERRGIFPPIDILPSLSRLMNAGIGAASTREDHRAVADQAAALLGRGQALRRLISIVGEQALSDQDRRVLTFVEQFERQFIGQDVERRTIEQTLDLIWELLEPIPTGELRRLPPELINRYRLSSPEELPRDPTDQPNSQPEENDGSLDQDGEDG